MEAGQAEPRVYSSEPFQPDSWEVSEDEDKATRSPAGEYLPVTFLSTGELAVVTPIQDKRGKRWGFSWWQTTEAP